MCMSHIHYQHAFVRSLLFKALMQIQVMETLSHFFIGTLFMFSVKTSAANMLMLRLSCVIIKMNASRRHRLLIICVYS